MKVNIVKAFVVVLLSGLMLACSGAGPETPSWLLGRWQVVHNPNQDANDVLWFQQGSKVSIEMEDGRRLQGHYQLQQDQLVMSIQLERRSVETQMQVSMAQDRLTFSNGSYYMKASSKADPKVDDSKAAVSQKDSATQ